MDSYIYRMQGFPRDGHVWRVLLSIGVDRNFQVPSDPQIEILLAEVERDGWRSSPGAWKTTGKLRNCWISAGLSLFVRNGTLWQDGVPLEVPYHLQELTTEAFSGVEISPSTVRFLSADAKLPGSDRAYVIPPYEFALGNRGLRTSFLAVDYEYQRDVILIPVMEIGWFYYFNSSTLAKRLLWGHLDKLGGLLFDRGKSEHPQNGVGRLHLRPGIEPDDAWVISRFAYSELACNRAMQIHNSLMKKSVNGKPLVPEILPPFDGKTDWIVRGKWFSSGGTRRFLVSQLVSCSHPFGCDSLIISKDMDLRNDGTNDPDRPEFGMPRSGRANDGETLTRVLRSDSEPRSGLFRLSKLMYDGRFVDLRNKSYQIAPPEPCTHRASDISSPNITVDGWSSGDGVSSGGNVGPINLVRESCAKTHQKREPAATSKRTAFPPSLEAFEQVIECLSRTKGIICEYIQPTGLESDGKAVCFPDPQEKNQSWSRIGLRRRLALVAQVKVGHAYHYFLEAERKNNDPITTLHMRDPHLRQLSDEVIQQTIKRCANYTGNWFRDCDEDESVLVLQKHKHTWPSPEQFAKSISLGLLRMVGIEAPNKGPMENQVQKNDEIASQQPATA